MICPRCGKHLDATAAECHGCGMPTTFMGPDDGLVHGDIPVVEPEVLESLDEADRTRFVPPARQLGRTLGPGCGCLGLPLAVAAAVLFSPLLALLWILSLGRVPFSLAKLMQRVRRGPDRG